MGKKRGIIVSAKFTIGRSSSAAADASSSNRGGKCYDGYVSEYPSLDKVVEALKRAGLCHLNLIIGIHFTETNYWRGDQYERAISIIEETLRSFDGDNSYHCFGVGDGKAEEVFSFRNDDSPCKGITEVLTRYRDIVPNVTLSGPTSYAPVIDVAVGIVERSCGRFHTLVLVADNQVTRSFFNSKTGKLSPEGINTITSIVNASSCPLSIILVGIGDGSWEHMKNFQDKIPERKFDNFQFVNFTAIEDSMSRDATPSMKEAAFAFAALKDTPLQYKVALELKLIRKLTGKAKKIVPRNPPVPSTHHAPATSEQSDLSEPVSDKRCQQVTDAFRKALESSNFIVGIDFTKSNEWIPRTGNVSSNIQNLHAIGVTPNLYEKVISLIGKTFAPSKKDNKVHCFGFGDVTTVDHYVFSFHPDQSPCYDFEESLACYRRIVRNVELADRASYAPIIEAAVDIVEKTGGQYHVLIIIAAGQVTSSYTGDMGLSPQEEYTIRSIADASSYPLFIIVVGVGDGPWEDMKKFEDKIPVRNNFQFVNFTDIMSRHATTTEKEDAFALTACMTLPIHYMAAFERGLVGNTTGKANNIIRRPPPAPKNHCAPPTEDQRLTPSDDSAWSVEYQRMMFCSVCEANEKNLAFGCGHRTCIDCGFRLTHCPMCRKEIGQRLKLYN